MADLWGYIYSVDVGRKNVLRCFPTIPPTLGERGQYTTMDQGGPGPPLHHINYAIIKLGTTCIFPSDQPSCGY